MKPILTISSLFLLTGLLLSSSCKKKTPITNTTVNTPKAFDSGQIIVKVCPYKITAPALPNIEVFCFLNQADRDTAIKYFGGVVPNLFTAITDTIPPDFAIFTLPAVETGTWYWFYTFLQYNNVIITKKDSFQLFPCNFRVSGGCKDTMKMVCE